MNRVTKEPWFGKEVEGWGIRPVSWHGRLVSLIFVSVLAALMVLAFLNYQDVWQIELVIALVILVFVLIALMSSDKKDRTN
jgi:hypothetical protein